MKKPIKIPRTGIFSAIAQQIDENFLLQYQQLMQYYMEQVRFGGLYTTEAELNKYMPTGIEGAYAYVAETSVTGDTWAVYIWNPVTNKWERQTKLIPAGNVTVNQEFQSSGTSSGGGTLTQDLKVTTSVGYLTQGLKFDKGTPIEDILRKMLYAISPASMNVTCNKSEVKVGEPVSGTKFTVTINQNDSGDFVPYRNPQTLEEYGVLQIETALAPSTTFYVKKKEVQQSAKTWTYTYEATGSGKFTKGTITFKASAVMGKVEGLSDKALSGSVSVTAYNTYFYKAFNTAKEQVIKGGSADEDVLKNYIKSSSMLWKNGNGFSVSLDNTKGEDAIMLIVPVDGTKSIHITNVKEGGELSTGEDLWEKNTQGNKTYSKDFTYDGTHYLYKIIVLQSPMNKSTSFDVNIK